MQHTYSRCIDALGDLRAQCLAEGDVTLLKDAVKKL